MVPVIAAAAAQRLDMTKADPESVPRSLHRSLSLDDRPYERVPLGPALVPGLHHNWDHLPPVTSTNLKRDTPTISSRVPSSAMPRTLPLSPIGPQSSTWAHNDGPATIQRDRVLSSHLKEDSTQAPPPLHRPRGFFDIVLAPPDHIPTAKEPDTTLTDLSVPSKPTSVTSHRAPPVDNVGKKKKKRTPKRKEPTPEPEPSSSEYESVYDPESESSDEDEPAPARGPVKLMGNGGEDKHRIPTSNIRGHCSIAVRNNTRIQFDREYSRHTRPIRKVLATKPARFWARSVQEFEELRKAGKLPISRSTTPASGDTDSATDISVSFVAGSSRAVSVASTTATAPRSKPKPKSKPKTPRSKSAPRTSTSSDSSRDLSTPQPVSTSIAYSPDDPPPPAPTNVVSLRPGYNAYTAEDKQWFLDFVGWVFRQNVRAGKAEICQDIFQQAPHHRLESWKSYWRDHISQVEMLRNRARERLVHPEPKRKPVFRSSPSTSTSSDGATTFDGEANKASEGLWKLAELAELHGSVSNGNRSNKRAADDASAQQRTKRSRY